MDGRRSEDVTPLVGPVQGLLGRKVDSSRERREGDTRRLVMRWWSLINIRFAVDTSCDDGARGGGSKLRTTTTERGRKRCGFSSRSSTEKVDVGEEDLLVYVGYFWR